MINYIAVFQTSILLLLHYVIFKNNNVTDFSSELWAHSANQFAVIMMLTYHISLFFLNIELYIYLWFIFSMIHYFIHAYRARQTIIESGKYTIDELWHFLNQLVCQCYLYIHSVNPTYTFIYACCLTCYIIMFTMRFWGIKLNKPLYYLGSSMAIFFLYSLRPNSSLYGIILYVLIYFPVVHIITFKNMIGSQLILINIAGCAFISEAIVILALHNNLY